MDKKGFNVKGEILLKSSSEVEWRIEDFFLLPGEYLFYSPSFSYLHETWRLIYGINGSCMINVGLHRDHSTSPRNITFRLGIKSRDGLEYTSVLQRIAFKVAQHQSYFSFPVHISFLRKRKSSFAYGNEISFFCTCLSGHSKDAASETIRSHGASEQMEENSVDDIKEDVEDDDTKLEFTTKIDVNNLVQNFKDLLLREERSDILVKVKDKEFKAHKAILGARSSVFFSMFAHDTLEKRTNIVELTDCEPDAFMQFLMYIYTGRVQKVPGDQVFDLYLIADKYNVEGLKKECVNFLKDHMTVDTFCAVMSLALRHNEMSLIESATKYFVENAVKIIVTTKWMTFVKEHPVESNELHIKNLTYGNKK